MSSHSRSAGQIDTQSRYPCANQGEIHSTSIPQAVDSWTHWDTIHLDGIRFSSLWVDNFEAYALTHIRVKRLHVSSMFRAAGIFAKAVLQSKQFPDQLQRVIIDTHTLYNAIYIHPQAPSTNVHVADHQRWLDTKLHVGQDSFHCES